MIGLISATAAGRTGAERLAAAWPGRTRRYEGPVRETLPAAFAECDQLVVFLATGAAVRLLAPLLAGKGVDPGVVTVDETHRHAVALLGGHGGGANALAEEVSAVLGAAAVITTATDSVGVGALDLLPYPVEGAVAAVTRAMVDGSAVALHADATWPLPPLPACGAPTTGPTPPPAGPAAADTHPHPSDTGTAPPDAAESGGTPTPHEPRPDAGPADAHTQPADAGTAPPDSAVPLPPDAAGSGGTADPDEARPATARTGATEAGASPAEAGAHARTRPADASTAPPSSSDSLPPDAAGSGGTPAPDGPRPATARTGATEPAAGPADAGAHAHNRPASAGTAPPDSAVPYPPDAASVGGTATPDEVPDGYVVWVTDRVVGGGGEGDGEPRRIVFVRPPSLVVGVGASRGVGRDEVLALVAEGLDAGGLAPASLTALATVDAKADEAGIVAAAAHLGVPLLTYPATALAEVAVPNPSPAPLAAVGTPSVAEAAALLAAGPGAELAVQKRKSAMATVAVARRRPRGRLAVVGLGPGARDLVTPRAVTELRRASVVVGLDQYVDQIRDLLRPGTRVLESGLGAEEERARTAVAQARAGHAVALIGSGDAGVYAMASPALAEAADDIDVIGVPGVTAALAAAALLGAPLGHDHVSISLSDLHTPWDVIERRVRAAAESDLVVTFYNPRSRGRDWQLPKALSILAEHRAPSTPVGVVRAASRPDEHVQLTTLATLDPATVDMVTVVTVGNTATRDVSGRMVTPRGYRWQTSDRGAAQ
ncbi:MULTISPECIES: precorrin-3B C(17)-methyltransferase [unclassified Streptomyces]|uniref:precorrin-3B C(17)-methyltransferase n=1 Tax=unclassified Streptomyces TaxID=2593676 RepID=UPI002E2D9A17|nr:precorrin-3B C(17)-methyltransferase [Streptomyces sp. NBC_00223]